MAGPVETDISSGTVTIDTPSEAAGTYTGNPVVGTDGADTLSGTAANDIIVGEKGSDTIVQNVGDGDDILVGGQIFDTTSGGANPTTTTHVDSTGANTYHFNFNVTQTEGETVYFRDGNTPNPDHADAVAWNNYLKQLAAWRTEMGVLNGADTDTDTQHVDLYTSTKKALTYIGGKDYDNSYTTAGETTIQGDGNDTVLGFNADDKIEMGGLTSAQFATYATHEVVDGNTIIHIGDSSITLVGVTDWTAVSSQLVFA